MSCVDDRELEPSPYFVEARVGDLVYEMAYGEGKITEVNSEEITPIRAIFGNGLTIRFTLKGAYGENCLQTLFYSKPIFDLPPPPKRKVKKVAEGWIMINPQTLRKSKEEAEYSAKAGDVGEARFVHHEYEE